MNTVMRTLGGALGGQLSATFIADHMSRGEPTVTGFTQTFLMATGFLVVCLFAGLLVPKPGSPQADPALRPRRPSWSPSAFSLWDPHKRAGLPRCGHERAPLASRP